jgi:hypothetical protein
VIQPTAHVSMARVGDWVRLSRRWASGVRRLTRYDGSVAAAVGAVLVLMVGTGARADDGTASPVNHRPYNTTLARQHRLPREPPGDRTGRFTSPSDTFPHERHSRLACLSCHDLRSTGRRLTFEAPGGCRSCHHQQPTQARCAACHQAGQLSPPVSVQVTVSVPRHDRKRRSVQFYHVKHDTLACTTCHVTPVTLAPADSVRTCTACHASHHGQSRDCASCHRTAEIMTPHQLPVQAHGACDACHTPATVARLVPARAFCLTCHSPGQDHHPPTECSACHFQRSPAELQPRLHRGGAPS